MLALLCLTKLVLHFSSFVVGNFVSINELTSKVTDLFSPFIVDGVSFKLVSN